MSMKTLDIPWDRLAAALSAGPPLRFAMLFGSAAKGIMRADSDVDVAIYPRDPSLPLADELALQTELTRVCGRDVDLVRLDRAPTLVCWQVVRYGRLLIEQVPFSAARFTARAVGDYLDFAPALDAATETFRRRLVSRGSGASS
jgi:predicted nucleotidyltransferase